MKTLGCASVAVIAVLLASCGGDDSSSDSGSKSGSPSVIVYSSLPLHSIEGGELQFDKTIKAAAD